MKRSLTITIAILLLQGFTTLAARAQTSLERLSPYIGDSTLVVGQIDLKQLDVQPILDIARRLRVNHRPEVGDRVQQELDVLRRRGFSDVFVVFDVDSIRLGPFLLAAVPEGQDATIAARDLQSSLETIAGDKLRSPGICRQMGEFVFLGDQQNYQRLTLRETVSERPDILSAIKSIDRASIKLVAVPTQDIRRALREMLPAQVRPGLSTDDLLRGITSVSFSLDTQVPPSAKLIVRSEDAAAAQRLNDLKTKLVYETFGSDPQLRDVLDNLKTEVQGDQLQLQLTIDRASTIIDGLLTPMRRRAYEAQNMNNLKQLALALHNFNEAYGSFPPAASYDRDNKPLLSWRVYVLPFIEQEALYKRFHLDEPWDSPHNRSLIAEMPAVFRSPSARTEPGKTTYLVPVGESTVFSQPVGTRMVDIRDGTSNTILLVDVASQHAVPWTQPEDWHVDLQQPYRGLLGDHDSFTAALCDGSVRKLPKTLSDETMRRLISKADGKPVEW
jgi:hypothetical protein